MPLQNINVFSNDVFEMIRGIVVILDPMGQITLCNSYFENLTGYASSEIIGEDWFDIFIPESDRKTIRAFFEIVMTEGLNDGYTNSILTKAGEQRIIEWNSKTLDGANGQIIGMLCTGFDVTERTAITLELEKSKKIAMTAIETKSRFLGSVSHDLRQPLQSLGLYLAALSKQSVHSSQQHIVYKMRQSLNTMSGLIDSLLNISKLDSGSVIADKCDVHIKELLERVVNKNMQQAEIKGIQIECQTKDFVVHTDPILLETMIETLVTNAIRFTDKGYVKLDCLFDEGSVKVAISDTGIGIPENHIQSVFEEYYQIDNQVRDKQKGIGLGLSIVKHISRILDHTLDVTSKVGHGSTFTIEVPLSRQNTDINLSVVKNTSISLQDTVILFVDDDPAVLDATTMLLSTYGVKVHGALTGDEALTLVSSGICPDIIVSDYRLPKYNGIEVISRVRNATAPNLPAILITGEASLQEIENENIGNCTVMQKPVAPDTLISLISHILE
jgi:PAS domain S-box-containing protein